MKKKILSILLFTLIILPVTVLADAYYRITEYKGDNETLSFTYPGSSMTNYPWVQAKTIYNQQLQQPETIEGYGQLNLSTYYSQSPINPNPPSDFSMKLQANEFDTDKSYQVIITSSTINYNETYTGEQLNTGVTVTITNEQMSGGMATLQVKEANTTNLMNFKATSCDQNPTQACDTTSMGYQEYLYTTIEITFGVSAPQQGGGEAEFDEIMGQISPNGVIELDAIRPTGEFTDSVITAALQKKYSFDGYRLLGSIDGEQGELVIQTSDESAYQTYQVEYVFKEPNNIVSELINGIYERLTFTSQEIFSDYDKRFIVEDLDSINYLYNIQKTTDEMLAMNSIVNYSSKIHELVGNANVDFMFDIRLGGGDSEFYEMVMGPMNILYNGTIYGNIDPIGYSLTKIIYVPSDTTKSRQAFIEAAETRIKEYLKGIDVQITYGGNIDDLEPIQYSWLEMNTTNHTETLHDLFDKTKTTGEWYNVLIGEETYKYFIVADSSKMKTPFMKTKDVNTNIYVTTDAFDAPLDSRLSVNKLDKNSDEYKALESKLNIIKGLAFDLNLYSTSLDMYITKLSNGNFKVYIPIDEETAKKTLVAVYIKEDGTKEEHEITIENGYAVFETNHFSTYAITEKTANPKTGDNIIESEIILTLSMIGLGITIYNKKKLFN